MTISKKIIWIILLSIIVAVLPTEILIYFLERDIYFKALDQNCQLVADRLSNSISYSMWTLNVPIIQRTIELEMSDKSLSAVYIFNPDNEELYTGVFRSHDSILLTSNKIDNFKEYIENASLIRKSKIEWANELLGYIYVVATDEQMVVSLTEKFIQMNILVLLIIFAISSTLFLILRRIIANPLSRLQEGVSTFTLNKDFSIRVEENQIGEIGSLGVTFNKMISELEINYHRRAQLLEKLNNQNIELQQEILERQEIEKSLIVSESKYQELFNTLVDSFISLDLDGKIIEMNPAFLRLTNYNQEEIQNQSIDTILEDDLFKEDSQYKRELFTYGHTEVYETKIITQSKVKIPVEIRSHLTMDSSGMPFRAWIIIRDISERKNAEMQLLQAQKMETLGNLAGGLAHDFNNVLGAIVGNTSLLKTLLANNMYKQEDLGDFLDTIEKASDRARNMVQQLLAISRKQELSLAPVDLILAVKHVLSICESTFDKSVVIIPEFLLETATVNADSTQIEQTILNLMVNAYHSMTIMRKNEKQGGQINITVGRMIESPPEIPKHDNKQDYYFIRVVDQGVGIPESHKSKIFEPFFSTKEKDKGTGLGLSMVLNIIKRHHGYINMDSYHNKGSTFTVYLPEYSSSHKQKQSDDLVKGYTSGSGLIMVVDDEVIIRKTAQKILAVCGYDTILAEDGKEAISIYKDKFSEIDMVILDMVMPEMSGKDVYSKLKEINPKIKTLMASGFGQDERVLASIKMGVNAFIPKPYNLSQLSLKIKEILNSSED